MMDVKQATRTAEITTPLGADFLVLTGFTVSHEMNRDFTIRCDLASRDYNIVPQDILGQTASLRLQLQRDRVRHWHGFITDFRFSGTRGRHARYSAVLRPWTWIANHRRDCRIFQFMKVPDIIQKVIDDSGFGDLFDPGGLTVSYPEREYCVQYNEGDVDFIARLMEEEGISFYFIHSASKHILTLSDSVSTLSPAPGYETVPFFPEGQSGTLRDEHIDHWMLENLLAQGTATQRDYDFSAPRKDMEAKATQKGGHAHDEREWFEWPGGYFDLDPGQSKTRVRIEELRARSETVAGGGNVRGLEAGRQFELSGFPRDDQNRSYILLAVEHAFESGDYETGEFGGVEAYSCNFQCVDASLPLRPLRKTPRPRVYGPQTATVVGPAGEEIYTDEHGRIKVQFHWDREGQYNDQSSCWIRVSQPWAHKGWGWQHIPRIGQEVLVVFLEGDPDRPIVSGALYNGDNAPPFSLPANKTQSGVRSNSSKGGGGSNEIRFEDKKGDEQIYIHAEKDEDIEVENNATRWVGVNRTKDIGNNEDGTIGNNQTNTVGKNQTIAIGVDRSLTVGANETTAIGINRTETVGASETVSVTLARTHTIGTIDSLTIGAAQAVTVGATRAVTVGTAQNHQIGGDDVTAIGTNQSLTIKSNRVVQIGENQSQKIGASSEADIGKDYLVNAGDSITFVTGKSSLTMKKDGTIVLKGKDIKIEGSGAIQMKSSKDTSIKASGNVIVKGRKINNN